MGGRPSPSPSHRNENLDVVGPQRASDTHCAKASEATFARRAARLGRAAVVNLAASWIAACIVIGEDVFADNEISAGADWCGCL
jgi:hypothetical protein